MLKFEYLFNYCLAEIAEIVLITKTAAKLIFCFKYNFKEYGLNHKWSYNCTLMAKADTLN
jgi:hypothetical protein